MKYNTQNAKIKSITEKTLIVGIDVGSETHFARAFDWRNYEYSKKPLEFSNTEAGFMTLKAWMADFAEKYGKNVVIPGMEPTGHYWFNLGAYLQDNGMKPVHVNPHHVKKSKELDDNNPNKNDRKDPKTIAALVNEGRFSYPYIPTGIYAEIRSLSNLRLQTQEEITRIKNRIARWFSIYFPEIKDVYRNPDSVSGLMILKEAPLPQDIVKLGVDGINKIWRDAKLRAAGLKRAKTLVTAAEHSIGSQEAPDSARIELKNLLNDYEIYKNREEDLMSLTEEKLSEIPHIDKLLEIKGVGLKTVSGFVAEVGDITRFDNPKQLQKLAGYAIVECSSGKHKGESHISYRGRKRLRYVLYEAAISLIARNEEFKEVHRYYRTRKENPQAYCLEEVELGKNYAMVISTSCGLWRYMIGDTVKFTSKNPYKFVITGRTKHFINAFGEELIVDNAEKGLAKACAETGAQVSEYSAAPVFMDENAKCRHQWLIEFAKMPDSVEKFAAILDATLKEVNSDYEAKRWKDIALQPLEVIVARQGLFHDWLAQKGKLGGQHKIPRLSNTREYIETMLLLNQ